MAETQTQQLPENEKFKGLEATVEVQDETDNTQDQNINDTSIPHRIEDVSNDDESNKNAVREKPDYVPEKFWDAKKGEIREEETFKSIGELEKAFSQGKHKAPEEYETETLKEKGYEVDNPLVAKYISWAKDNGISQKAFDDLAKSIIETSGEQQQTIEYEEKVEKEKLGKNADEIIKSNKLWANSLLNKGLLNDEEREELSVLAYTAAGQKVIQKIRSWMGETRTIPISDVAVDKETDTEFDARMQSMMSDSRYGSDPKFTMEVEGEFKKRFGNQKTA